jgi:hypothetical protein
MRRFAVVLVLLAGNVWAGENWVTCEGGGAHHNASAAEVPPEALCILWQREFEPAVKVGEYCDPPNEMNIPGAKASQNLVLLDGKLALIAADGRGFPAKGLDAYLTVLDAANGKTINCIQIEAHQGNNRVYNWPHSTVSASCDTATGLIVTAWDPETAIFYTGVGSYQSGYTAYRPLANAASYRPGQYQQGVPAILELFGKHPGYQDAFGRTRGEMISRIGVQYTKRPFLPQYWGQSGLYVGPDAEKGKTDLDYTRGIGVDSLYFYNSSAYMEVDPAGPLMGITMGNFTSHCPAGQPYLYGKHTGMKAMSACPETRIIEPPTYSRKPSRLRPFTSRGLLIANGRVFMAGPGDDLNSNGDLGGSGSPTDMANIDQGLYLWAYDYHMEDRKPNDGVEGHAAAETAVLRLAFTHRFVSRPQEDRRDPLTVPESYIETDGFYRNRAMLADGKTLWVAWKPSARENVELIHASDAGVRTFDLGVGAGVYGAELWPHMSLVEAGGGKLIAYFTGRGCYRQRYVPDDPTPMLRHILSNAVKHMGQRHPLWDDMPREEQLKRIAQARQCGFWTDQLFPPRGPAQFAVFDCTASKLKWTYDVPANHPSQPANDFWCSIDRTQMVAAGKWVYLGWVDATGPDTVLRLLALDVTAPRPTRIERALPLGFASTGNRRSTLMDLIAADGRLYALVLRSDVFWIRDARWTALMVLAIGPQ